MRIFLPVLVFLLLSTTANAIDAAATFLGGAQRNLTAPAAPALPLRHEYRFQADGETVSSPVIADGRIFFGCRDQHIYALNAADGSLLWRYRTRAAVDATPTVWGGTVYTGSRDGSLYALRAEDGRLLFRVDTDSPISSSVLVHNSRLYFTTEIGQELRCHDALTGEALWQGALDQPSQSSPALAGETVLVGDNSGKIYGFSPADGSLRFAQATSGSCGFISPAVHGSSVYFAPGILDRNLYAFDFDGNLLWMYTGGPTGVSPAPTPGTRIGLSQILRMPSLRKLSPELTPLPGIQASPERPGFFLSFVDPNLVYNSQGVASDGTRLFYVSGNPTAYLVAVDITTRTMAWNLSLGEFPDAVGHYSAPVLTPAGLLINDSLGTLLIIDPLDGTVRDRKPLFAPSYGTPAVSAERIVCLNREGLLTSLVSGPDPAATGDTIPPTIQVIQPAEDGNVDRARPELFVVVDDTGTGIDFNTVVVLLDGATVAVEVGRLQFFVRATLPELSDGPHSLSLSLQDLAGNSRQKTWNFTVAIVAPDDSLPPVVSARQPAAASTVRFSRMPEISFTLLDEGGSGLDPVETRIYLDGQTLHPLYDPATGRVSAWPLLPLEDGLHTVIVEAADLSGNRLTGESWSFTLEWDADGDLPLIDNFQPAAGATITTTRRPQISVRLSDNQTGIDPGSLVLRLDGQLLDHVYDAGNSQLTALPPSDLSDGEHELQLFVSDRAGNSVDAAWSFHIAWRIGNGRVRASLINGGARISWTTEIPARSRVEYATTEDFSALQTATDLRGADHSGTTHFAEITGLSAGQTVWFRVVSELDGENETNADGVTAYSFRVPASIAAESRPVRGRILKSGSPAAGMLIYLSIGFGDGEFSLPLSTLSGTDGSFTLDLAALRRVDGTALPVEAGMKLRLFVQGAEQGIAWHQQTLSSPLAAEILLPDQELAATIQVEIPMLAGLNLTAFFLAVPPFVNSHELLTAWPGIQEIATWDPVAQSVSIAARLFGNPAGDLFDIARAGAYYLNFLGSGVFLMGGAPADAPLALILREGLNAVAFPFASEAPDRPLLALDARELLETVPQVREIHLFDPALQRFVAAVFRLDSGIQGTNFPLRIDAGYFIRSDADVSFTPSPRRDFGPQAPAAAPARMARNISLPNRVPELQSIEAVNLSPGGFEVLVLLDSPARVRVRAEGREWFPREGQTRASRVHLIPLDCYPGSALKVYAENGIHSSARSLAIPPRPAARPGLPRILTGRILTTDNAPRAGLPVIVRIRANGERCLPLACLSDAGGRWFVNLADLRRMSGEPPGADAQLLAEVFVRGQGLRGMGIYPVGSGSPVDCGDLIVEGSDEQ